MDRFLLSQCKLTGLKSLHLTTKKLGFLHQSHYERTILNSGKCLQCKCKTQQISRFSDLKLMKQELKAWKGVLRSADILKRHQPVVYSGGKRLYSEQQKRKQDEQGSKDKKPSPDQEVVLYEVIGVMLILGLKDILRRLNKDIIEMSWSTFETDFLLKGQVERLHLFMLEQNQVVEAELHPDSDYRRRTGRRSIFIDIVSSNDFTEKLQEFERKYNIPVLEKLPVRNLKVPPPLHILINLALLVVTVGLIRGRRIRIIKDIENQMKFPGGLSSNFADASGRMKDKKDLITFSKIAGQKEAIIELKEFVDYVTRPLKYQRIGAKVPHGALLTGPPGCGKTLLAKALAGESKVPFYAMAGSEFVEIFGGLGASRVRDLFKKARANSPCIIYIDEIDTIGKSRAGSGATQPGDSETESTLNQLLVEMDGMTTVDGVIVLASTNRGEVLDKALMRPGRFDRHILIDLPTLKEREELFQLYLSDIKTDSISLQSTISRLALLTPGLSGADIASVCNEAAIYAARHQKTSVGDSDLDYSVERFLDGIAKASRTISPAERKVVAYHEAGHVIAKCFLEGADKLLKVSIVSRTSDKPSFSRFQPTDKKLHTKEDLFMEMCVALGGRAAEAIVFNKITSAAEDDLKRITKIAYNQIKSFGMSSAFGLLAYPTDEEMGSPFARKPYSKKLARQIDEEARRIVATAYQETESLLKLHRVNLDKVANELLEKETLNKEELAALLDFKTEETVTRRFQPDLELL